MENKKWKPVDYIVFILTIVVGLSVLLGIVKPIFGIETLPSDTVKIIGNSIIAMIAIISIYVGSKLKK